MAYGIEELRLIYDRTAGYCHICGKKLAFTNYGGARGGRMAWEVDHSVPRANGGTDYLRNLYAACICCNREKRAGSTKAARARYGRSRAPMSRLARAEARARNAVVGATTGAVLGGVLFGPWGFLAGATLGTAVGRRTRVG